MISEHVPRISLLSCQGGSRALESSQSNQTQPSSALQLLQAGSSRSPRPQTEPLLQSYAQATSHQSLFQDSTEVHCLMVPRIQNSKAQCTVQYILATAIWFSETQTERIRCGADCTRHPHAGDVPTSQRKNHMYRQSPS